MRANGLILPRAAALRGGTQLRLWHLSERDAVFKVTKLVRHHLPLIKLQCQHSLFAQTFDHVEGLLTQFRFPPAKWSAAATVALAICVSSGEYARVSATSVSVYAAEAALEPPTSSILRTA